MSSNVTTAHTFRCGDTARIDGTDYDIEVAYADPASGRASWCGWPNGDVETSKLTLVAACTDEEHKAAVERWLSGPLGADRDHRRETIERLYRPRAYLARMVTICQDRVRTEQRALDQAADALIAAQAGPEDA